jgi:hypothetical protein
MHQFYSFSHTSLLAEATTTRDVQSFANSMGAILLIVESGSMEIIEAYIGEVME